MKTLTDFNFKDKKALIRVDFNIPLNTDFKVIDATRIEATKSTIIKVLEDGGRVILLSHLGRPSGVDDKYSLRHIVTTVTEILGVQVQFVPHCVGKQVEEAVNNLGNGSILLLENLRFHPQEKAASVDFAKMLAQWGDIYVNDAFGVAHRANASNTVITQFFPENKCFGNLFIKEIENLNRVLKESKKPVTAIMGGAKVSSKIGLIKNILDKVDHIIIGGGMTFTFIKALGGEVGNSLIEQDKILLALEILDKAKAKNTQIHLPVDALIADAFKNDANTQVMPINKIPKGWMGLDIGEQTIAEFTKIISLSKTVLWNGPVGVFEMENFSIGTRALGDAVVQATENGAFSLVGGGDSVAAVKQFGFADKVSYVSTGGGAMLTLLEGKKLPGIEAMVSEN